MWKFDQRKKYEKLVRKQYHEVERARKELIWTSPLKICFIWGEEIPRKERETPLWYFNVFKALFFVSSSFSLTNARRRVDSACAALEASIKYQSVREMREMNLKRNSGNTVEKMCSWSIFFQEKSDIFLMTNMWTWRGKALSSGPSHLFWHKGTLSGKTLLISLFQITKTVQIKQPFQSFTFIHYPPPLLFGLGRKKEAIILNQGWKRGQWANDDWCYWFFTHNKVSLLMPRMLWESWNSRWRINADLSHIPNHVTQLIF